MGITQSNTCPMYIEPSRALEICNARKHLREQVEAWWKRQNLPPHPLSFEPPKALLARQIASARYEDLLFNHMAKSAGFDPCWLELLNDIFVSTSSYKRAMIKRRVIFGRGRKGGLQDRNISLKVDMNKLQGTRLKDILDPKTGKSLPDIHHELQDRILPNVYRVDGSEWVAHAGDSIHARYRAKLSVYVAHGVLFEDYHGITNKTHLRFTQRVFEPAREFIIHTFGVAPMMVQLPHSPILEAYPADENWRSHGILPADLVV